MYSLGITLINLANNSSTEHIYSITEFLESQKSIILNKLPPGFDATISASLMNLQGIVLKLNIHCLFVLL